MKNEVRRTEWQIVQSQVQEHLRDYKYNTNKSKFAQQLIDNRHAIGTMEGIMEVVHVTKKGKLMNTLEGFHIYKETKANNQINDRLTVRENAVFETIIQEDSYRGHATPRFRTTKKTLSCRKSFTPAGSESYTGTAACQLLHDNPAMSNTTYTLTHATIHKKPKRQDGK
jgi:hypothetical protein